jgi:hypothetical protein
MTARTRWPAARFGLAVDKAVLDALLTQRVERGHAWRGAGDDLAPARAYLAELHRLLAPGAGGRAPSRCLAADGALPLQPGCGIMTCWGAEICDCTQREHQLRV